MCPGSGPLVPARLALSLWRKRSSGHSYPGVRRCHVIVWRRGPAGLAARGSHAPPSAADPDEVRNYRPCPQAASRTYFRRRGALWLPAQASHPSARLAPPRPASSQAHILMSSHVAIIACQRSDQYIRRGIGNAAAGSPRSPQFVPLGFSLTHRSVGYRGGGML